MSARKAGLDISLFKRLSDAHPAAVVNLTHQYRMNEDIMFLSNSLVYEGQLKVGSEEVGGRRLKLTGSKKGEDGEEEVVRPWLREVIDPR
jgi:DNA replication ATP-dependent helicase Dna2